MLYICHCKQARDLKGAYFFDNLGIGKKIIYDHDSRLIDTLNRDEKKLSGS